MMEKKKLPHAQWKYIAIYRRVQKYTLIVLLKGIKREAPVTKLYVVVFLLVHDPQIL